MTTATAAPEPVFVDTNVQVYAAVPAFPLHVDAQAKLTELEAERLRGVKSGFRFFVGSDESPLDPRGPQTVKRILPFEASEVQPCRPDYDEVKIPDSDSVTTSASSS